MSSKLKTSHTKDGIHKVFDEISLTYDLVNQILSFGLDKLWRKKLSKCLKNLKNYELLDLATGTGDQVFSILKENSLASKVIGIDLSKDMLAMAKEKKAKRLTYQKAEFLEGNAINLEFSNKSFDIVTMSFGIRNVTDFNKCFSECHRVLRPSGKLYILEFSLPKNKIVKFLHLFYLRKVLPFVGGVISKKPSAYHYLNETIESFPYGKNLANSLKNAGFRQVNFYPLSFGITTLYEAVK